MCGNPRMATFLYDIIRPFVMVLIFVEPTCPHGFCPSVCPFVQVQGSTFSDFSLILDSSVKDTRKNLRNMGQ